MLTLDWLKSQKKPSLIKLAVQGFRKHFNRKEMYLSRVNFLLGPNNAGKTSFFEALELAAWMQKNGTIRGASHASIRKGLDLNPSMFNHAGSEHISTDFSIAATALIGERMCGGSKAKAELISNNSDAVAWRYETSDSKIDIFPGFPECKWVHGMIDPGGKVATLGSSNFYLLDAAKKMLAALNTLGLDINSWAEIRLTSKSGRDELFTGESGFDSSLVMPAMLRGRIASRNGQHLIFAGDNQFWLEDDAGRRINVPDWADFLGVDFNQFTKQDWVVVQALFEAALEHEKLINYVVDGRFRDSAQRVGDVLANCGEEWKSKVLDLGFYKGDGFFQNPYIKSDLSEHEDSDMAQLGDAAVKAHTVAGINENLVGWLRSQMEGLPDFTILWSEMGPNISEGKIGLHDPWFEGLKWSADLTKVFELIKADAQDESTQVEIWCQELERLGVDMDAFRAEFGLEAPEKKQSSSEQNETIEDVRREIEDVRRGIEEEIMREIHEEIIGDIQEEIKHGVEKEIMGDFEVEIIRGESESGSDLKQDFSYPDEWTDPRMDTIYGSPHESEKNLLGEDKGNRLWNDRAFMSKGKEGQLLDIWSTQVFMMMQPFSFELLRIKPDVAPLRGFYFEASEFPFEEIWELFRKTGGSESERSYKSLIRKGERIISASLAFLGIASRFSIQWRPLMKRLELNLTPVEGGIGEVELVDLFRENRKYQGTKRSFAGDAVVSRDSIFGPLGKRVLSVDELSRDLRRQSLERLEALGRGSRLVLQSLMAMFEASLRPSPTLVILEEPSAFLHPSLASKFTEVLRFAAKEFDVQVIVETHNEYMIRQLQTSRIKGEDMLDVTVHYFDGDTGDITRLFVEESGRIDPPIPEGFLDKSQTMMREQARVQMGKRPGPKGSGNVS